MKARHTLLFLAMAILLSLGVWALVGRPLPDFAVQEPAARSVQDATAAGFSIPGIVLVRGQQLEYDLNYSGEIPGEADQPAHRYALLGSLQVTALDESADGYRVGLNLKVNDYQGLEDLPPNFQKAWKGALAGSVRARLAHRGFALTLEDSEVNLDPIAKEFWSSLLERIQVRIPDILTSRNYSLEEKHNGLLVEASYSLDPSVDLSKLAQQKLTIEKTIENHPGSDRKVSGESLALMREGMDGLEELQYKSHESIDIKAVAIASESSVELRRVRDFRLNDEELAALERDLQRSRKAESYTEDVVQKLALGPLSLADIWAQMDANASSPQTLYLQLKAWIFLHPGSMDELSQRLMSLGPDDPRLRDALKALTAVGHPEGQKLMVQLLNAHIKDADLAKRIVTSLGFVKTPTIDAEAALLNLARNPAFGDIGRRAELALGIMGSNLTKSGERARAEALQNKAYEFLSSSQSSQAIQDALGMLGNLGPGDRQRLGPYLNHTDPEIRAQALFALRFSQQADTPSFLADAFIKDESRAVRKQILQALQLRPIDQEWFVAVDKLLDQKLSDDDQIALAQQLVQAARNNKAKSVELLGAMQKEAGNENVRARIDQYRNQAQRVTSF